jgi:hypothetical protein
MTINNIAPATIHHGVLERLDTSSLALGAGAACWVVFFTLRSGCGRFAMRLLVLCGKGSTRIDVKSLWK